MPCCGLLRYYPLQLAQVVSSESAFPYSHTVCSLIMLTKPTSDSLEPIQVWRIRHAYRNLVLTHYTKTSFPKRVKRHSPQKSVSNVNFKSVDFVLENRSSCLVTCEHHHIFRKSSSPKHNRWIWYLHLKPMTSNAISKRDLHIWFLVLWSSISFENASFKSVQ